MTGGVSTAVSVPAAASGIAIAGTGLAISGSALAKMFDVRIQKSESSDEKAQKAMENGEPRENHKIEKKRSLPTQGEANSSADLLNPDGTVKQRRYYGPDGKAQKDIDYSHTDDGTHTFPHEHKWDWSKTQPRQEASDLK